MNAKGQAVRIGFGVLLLFAVVAYTVNIRTAAWFIACSVVGYFNAFYVFRSVLALARMKSGDVRSWFLSALALCASGVIVFAGYGMVLVLATSAFILIDALVLKFK